MIDKKIFLIGSGAIIFFLTQTVTFLGARAVLQSATSYVPEEPISVWYILFLFLIMSGMILVLLRLVRGRTLFHVLFSLAMFAGVWFIADIFLPGEIALVVGAAVLLFRYVVPRVGVQNILVILGVSGVAVSLGLSIPWHVVLVLAVIFSVYDIGAVYWTKYMVTMMQGLLSRGVVFAAVIPSTMRDLVARLDAVQPGQRVMLVGTGDLAIPAVFTASLVSVSMASAVLVGLGALGGFIVVSQLFLGPSKKRPMPALPPIVAGMLIGFLISFVLP